MSEEQAQQLMYQMQMLENYFVDLSRKEESLIGIIQEAAAAIESIKSIDKKSESTLFPLGLGAFVKTKISSDEKLIVNIGSGVAVEKDKDSAINFIEARLKEMQVALSDTSNQKQQIMASLEQGKHEMNRLMQASNTKQ